MTATIPFRLSARTKDELDRLKSKNETYDQAIHRNLRPALLNQDKEQAIGANTNSNPNSNIDNFIQESIEMQECIEKYPIVKEKMDNLTAINQQRALEITRLQEKIASLTNPRSKSKPSLTGDIQTEIGIDDEVQTEPDNESILIEREAEPMTEEESKYLFSPWLGHDLKTVP